jgi:hypothetical protein
MKRKRGSRSSIVDAHVARGSWNPSEYTRRFSINTWPDVSKLAESKVTRSPDTASLLSSDRITSVGTRSSFENQTIS